MLLKKGFIVLIIIAVLGIIVGGGTIFIVPEGYQAVVLQFGGQFVQHESYKSPGVKFKLPFIHEVKYLEKRILSWDGTPNQIPTKDKKYIRVDTAARWKIVDPEKFVKAAQNYNGAKARLNDIIDAVTRDEVSNSNLVEVVRNSNAILETIEEKRKELQKREDAINQANLKADQLQKKQMKNYVVMVFN